MCGAEELQDDMSLKQVYLMNWSPRVSKKKKEIISPMLFGTCIHLPQFRVSDMLL